MIRTDRLVAAVTELAQRAEPSDVRAQLHALAGIIANVAPGEEAAAGAGGDPRGDERSPGDDAALADALDAAIAAGDEPAAIAAMRGLARRDRARVRPVDWSAASHG